MAKAAGNRMRQVAVGHILADILVIAGNQRLIVVTAAIKALFECRYFGYLNAWQGWQAC